MSKKEKVIELEDVVIRFAGDSGDGMQLTGTLFTDTAAILGNDLATFPDYPAEIRAPQGTVGGVSGFQVHLGHSKVENPGDYADIIVAMNPAALKANEKWVKTGGTIVLDIDSFTDKNIRKAGYEETPLQDSKFHDYNIIKAHISSLTREALKDLGLDNKSILRSKNMFALGMLYWMFERPIKHTEAYFEQKFKNKQIVIEANKKALKAGYNYAYTIEALHPHYKVSPAKIKPGKYRNINGNTATAWGLIAAAERAKMELFCGSYPITPATSILEELSLRRDLGVKTFQAEDEIAGISTAIGASFAGDFGVTTTSGPGLALKTEAAGLAVMAELPLVIVDVQRGGPSTGLPTKPEQSDLLQALHSRSGESPMPIIAASTPSNCFWYAFQAGRIALERMTPVLLLTDGFLANGSEPFKIPVVSEYPEIKPPFSDPEDEDYQPYRRDSKTFVRQWAIPGTPKQEHRLGGLEKMNITGNVSYVPENHEIMVNYRETKVQKVVDYIPDQAVQGYDEGELLVVGWGGTYGHLANAVKNLWKDGYDEVSLAHFNYIYPLPKNTGEILRRFKKVIVCELNKGQFAQYLRTNFQDIEFLQYNKVQGLPFTISELENEFKKIMEV